MSKIIGVTVGTPTSPSRMEEALKPVKTVNGIEPDNDGNVELAEVGALAERLDAVDETLAEAKHDISVAQATIAIQMNKVKAIDEAIASRDTVTWDGNIKGKATVDYDEDYVFVRVNSAVLTKEDIPEEGVTYTYYTYAFDTTYASTETLKKEDLWDVSIIDRNNIAAAYPLALRDEPLFFIFVPEDVVGKELTFELGDWENPNDKQLTFPASGLYFRVGKNLLEGIRCLTIPGCTGFDRTLNPKSLPYNVLTSNVQTFFYNEKTRFRNNIGAIAIDDISTVGAGGDTAAWYGNTEWNTVVDIGDGSQYVLVSSAAPTLEDIPEEGVYCTLYYESGGHGGIKIRKESFTGIHLADDELGEWLPGTMNFDSGIISISDKAAGRELAIGFDIGWGEQEIKRVTFPVAGLYFHYNTLSGSGFRSITIPGYTGFQARKLKPELLPIGDIESALDAIIAIQETLIGGGSV